jgi:hypothetical protein
MEEVPMSRQFALAVIIALAATVAHAGGVASLSEADITTNGDQAYKIVSTNGNDYRIWWPDRQWKDASGAQSDQNRNLAEQAEYLSG